LIERKTLQIKVMEEGRGGGGGVGMESYLCWGGDVSPRTRVGRVKWLQHALGVLPLNISDKEVGGRGFKWVSKLGERGRLGKGIGCGKNRDAKKRGHARQEQT